MTVGSLGIQLIVENAADVESDSLLYDFEVYSDPGLTVLEASDYGVSEQSDQTMSKVFTTLAANYEYWWQSNILYPCYLMPFLS